MSTKNHEHREEQRKSREIEIAAAREPEEAALDAKGDLEKPDSENQLLGAAAPSEEELAALREQVSAFEARESALVSEASSLKDQYLRKLADYENFRKRMFRERDESLKYANIGLLGDLVPILDNFDRAVSSAEVARDFTVLHDGIVLIRRQLGQTLENKYGLVRYDTVGLPFDPNTHEAVVAETGPVTEPTVIEELLPGYRLHDRIVRTAKVKVRMPAPEAAETSPDTNTEESKKDSDRE